MMQASFKAALSFRTITSSMRCMSSSSRPDLVHTASDYFTQLRWRAANALTSSLNDSEKQQLLKNLNAVPKEQQVNGDSKQTDDEISKSIGEAVAAARAEEAKRQESKWIREKEALLKEAEEAATARVESDLRIQERRMAFAQWTRELEEEKRVDLEKSLEAHPILGEAICDLGYKRIHVVSAKALANIPIWKKQRIYRHDRAKAMASDKLKTVEMGLPGIIALHEDDNGQLSILDGQHRVGMMTILEKKTDRLDLERVLVEVFPEGKDDSVSPEDIFVEINKAEPVKLVDMPGVARSSDRKTITQAAATLQETYADMFKPSERCRAPHLNVDNLRDALFASNALKRHSLTNQKALVAWMLEQNDLLRAKYEKEGAKNVSQTALDKAIKFDFYLGLESSWLYN